VERSQPARDSAEYAETVAEVFVETVRKASSAAMCCEHEHEEITPSLMECLQYVYLHGSSPVREIAAGLEVSVSAASQLVDRLVRRGLATRRENAEDRRLTSVELSDTGVEAVRQMRERRLRWFESVLGAMPRSRRSALLDGLESFLRVALASEENIDHACVRCGLEHVQFCVVNRIKSERSEVKRFPASGAVD